MSLPSTWRQFQLLDFLPIRDPNFKSETPLFSDPSLSAITSTQSYIVYVAQNATVKVLHKDSITPVFEYSAYDTDYRVTFMHALPHSNLLVTLAEKQMAPSSIKIWDLNKISQLSPSVLDTDDIMRHKFITQVQIHDTENSFPISCFEFNDSLTCMAIGYANGKIVLVRGDLLRDRGSKQRLIYEGSDPITGVHFHRSEEILYVVTTSKIFTILNSGRNKGKPLRILSNSRGASLGCSDSEHRSSRLIVANDDGFAYYNHITKAHTVPFKIPKRNILKIYKDYMLLVCPVEEISGRATITKLLVLDMHNMHVSFNLSIPNSSISHLFMTTGDDEVFLLSTDGVLYKLREKPINQQIEIILSRELYSIALNLAKQYNLDVKTMFRINKLHADHLYGKQDFDAAISKYVDCLSLFQANLSDDESIPKLDDFVISVVTKFREASNVHNMTFFLSQLHSLGLSDADHLTLLLCCYCKLKMTAELDDFISNLDLDNLDESRAKSSDMQNLDYSLIINLFRECGYFSQVIQLLYKLNRPSLIVDIQLNDLRQPQKCMTFIKSLPINELLGILIDYSKELLDTMPIDSTKLMIEVFTGVYQPQKWNGFSEEDRKDDVGQEVEQEKVQTSSYSALLGYLSNPLWQRAGNDDTNADLTSNEPTYLPPRPSLVFACFADHPKEFLVFLEACFSTFDKFQGDAAEKSGIVATLFETYLAMSVEDPDNESEWRHKAEALASANADSLDMSKTMLVSHIYGLQLSENVARTNSDTYEEDLFYTTKLSGDFKKTFDIVRQYGDSKPILYKLMLRFIVSSDENMTQTSRDEFNYLLHKITDHRLATLPELIQILSQNPNASIGLVKNILIEYISDSKREISNNQKLIESYEAESTKHSATLTELSTKPIVLQNKICPTCELKLEFPTIHFKCKHSYHQKCLNENNFIPDSFESSDPKCPMCTHKLQEAEEVYQSQVHTREDFNLFRQKLEDSEDRFKVIAGYIGRGVVDD